MKLLRFIPFAVLALLGGATFLWVTSAHTARPTETRLPGSDRPATTPDAAAEPAATLSGTFTNGDARPAELAGDWPAFRGPNHDGISTQTTPLSTSLSQSPPPKLWEMPLGEGYAGPAIHAGRAYLLDYDAIERMDVLRCFSPLDGREIWRRGYTSDVKRNHGMSRTVPAVDDTHVVTIGPKCQVVCLNAATGDFLWGLDMVRAYHAKVPPWYTGQCPLLLDGKVYLAPGSDALLVALDGATGKTLWQTPNPRGWTMTHTSIIPMEFGGFHILLYCGSGGLAGVDQDTGKLLFDTTDWRVKIAAVPSPVPLPDGRIFLSGGYDAGAMMIQLEPAGDTLKARVLWSVRADVFGAEQQTPIFYRNAIFGAIPGGQFVCLDLATGKQRWNSGAHRFGIGPYLIDNGVIFIASDTGTLSAIAADPQDFRLLGSTSAIDHGHECWGPMALADGYLLLRDLTRLVCLDLRAARSHP